MTPLTIVANLSGSTGYGRHAIRAIRDIEAFTVVPTVVRPISMHGDIPDDIKAKIVSESPGDWELLIHPPKPCFAPTKGKKTVWFSMFEATKLPPDSVQCLNLAEAVIVPNDWNAAVFSASGVTRPISIVPLGIDTRVFNFRPMPASDVMVFGTGGSGLRKGVDDVVEAFLLAFPTENNVRLRIKLSPGDVIKPVADSRIEVLTKVLTDAEMADWYASLHWFVSASRGEGWGFMVQEALAVGRPVMACRWAGNGTFLQDGSGYAIPSTLEPAEGIYKGALWMVPKKRAMVAMFENVFIDRPWGDTVNSLAATHCSWGDSSKHLIAALVRLGALSRPNKPPSDAVDCAARPKTSFYHSGNLGDVIYGLAAIKAAGGGTLLMGPGRYGTKSPITPTSKEQFRMLLPLLRCQPYLEDAQWRDFFPLAELGHDMNWFRDKWLDWPFRQRNGLNTLIEAQFYELGVAEKFDTRETWLTVPAPLETGRIVIHRSARYHQDDAMWRMLTARFRKHLLFVGLDGEHMEFEKQFGPVSFWKVKDFLELARLIAGARGCVMNQSFPCSLALAYGQRVYQETWEPSPDCVFKRASFYNQRVDIKVVSDWL
jgi:hypothetical protein